MRRYSKALEDECQACFSGRMFHACAVRFNLLVDNVRHNSYADEDVTGTQTHDQPVERKQQKNQYCQKTVFVSLCKYRKNIYLYILSFLLQAGQFNHALKQIVHNLVVFDTLLQRQVIQFPLKISLNLIL